MKKINFKLYKWTYRYISNNKNKNRKWIWYRQLRKYFKNQTSSEIKKYFKDILISKLIDNQNDDNKVLIWKINDKEIGILSIRANINNKFSIKNLGIEIYDNLLIPNFIKVVNYKRQLISKKKKEDNRIERKKPRKNKNKK